MAACAAMTEHNEGAPDAPFVVSNRVLLKLSAEMPVEIVVADNPPPAEREAILEPLRAFNEMRAGPSGYRTLAVLLSDLESGKTIGGLWGRLSYGWLHIDMLFVPEK